MSPPQKNINGFSSEPVQGDFGRPPLAEFGGGAPSFARDTDGAGLLWGELVLHGEY